MIELQKRQEEVNTTYNIRNYIFAIKTLNTSIESIENTAESLSNYISSDFRIDLSNSIIVLIVMDLQKVRIRTGNSLKQKITDNEAQKIINNMGTNMRTKNYYKAFYNIITDVKFYYENEEGSSGGYHPNETNSILSSIISKIFSFILFLAFCCVAVYCQRKGYCKNSGSSSYHSYSDNVEQRQSSMHNYEGNRNYSFGDNDNSVGGNDYSSGGGGYSGGGDSGGGGGGGGGSGGATGGW